MFSNFDSWGFLVIKFQKSRFNDNKNAKTMKKNSKIENLKKSKTSFKLKLFNINSNELKIKSVITKSSILVWVDRFLFLQIWISIKNIVVMIGYNKKLL